MNPLRHAASFLFVLAALVCFASPALAVRPPPEPPNAVDAPTLAVRPPPEPPCFAARDAADDRMDEPVFQFPERQPPHVASRGAERDSADEPVFQFPERQPPNGFG